MTQTFRLLKDILLKYLLIFTFASKQLLFDSSNQGVWNCLSQVLAQVVLFMCMNTAGIFISYLSDRAQRQAFLETRRCVEARLRLETENQRQVPNARLCLRCRQDSLLSRDTVFISNTCCFSSVISKSMPWGIPES